MGVAVFNNRLWVIGGGGANGTLKNDVWSSADGMNWSLITPSADFSPRRDMGIAVFNNQLWVIGGDAEGSLKNDVWSSPDGYNWTQVAANAEFSPRYGKGVATFDHKIWMIGGVSDSEYTGPTGYTYGSEGGSQDVWSSIDGKTWVLDNASEPFSSQEFTPVTVFDNKVWILGGGLWETATMVTRNPPPHAFNKVWSSTDGANWSLENGSAGFSPRFLNGVTVFRNGIWVIGGTDNDQIYGDVWYMPANNSATSTASPIPTSTLPPQSPPSLSQTPASISTSPFSPLPTTQSSPISVWLSISALTGVVIVNVHLKKKAGDMMSLKFNSLILGILLVMAIIPLVSADNGNVTPNTTPFITIDPIGNHIIGDELFINGTTNLPVSNAPLSISIITANTTSSEWGPSFSSDVFVQPGKNGINTWSVNATVGPGWSASPPKPQELIAESVAESVGTGNNAVNVYVSSPLANLVATQTFLLLPPRMSGPPQAPFITIDPIGNHAVWDTFFINGTTNLDSLENISLDVEWSGYNPGGFGSSFYLTNATILPKENGVSTWSAAILPDQWEIYPSPPPYHIPPRFESVHPGEYVVYTSPTNPLGPTVISQQTFVIFPLANVTPSPTPDFIVITWTESPGAMITTTRQSTPCPVYILVIAIFAVILIVKSRDKRK